MAQTCLPAATSGQSPAEERSLEHILGLPKPQSFLQSCALTLDDVFVRCSSQHYSNSVAASSATFIMEPGSYRSAWTAFTRWVQKAMLTSGKRTVLIWDIGFISHRLYAMGICIPTFTLADRFKRKYHLTQDLLLDATPDVRCTSNRIRCPLDVLTSTGLDTECALFAMQAICCNIGAMAKEGLSLEISFGVGVLRIRDQMARFEFLQHVAEDAKRASSSPRRPAKPSPSHGVQSRRPRAAQTTSCIASEPHYGRYLNIATTEAFKPAPCDVLPGDESGNEVEEFSMFARDFERQPNLCDKEQESLVTERHSVAHEIRSVAKGRVATLPQQVLDAHGHLVAATFKPHKRASSSVSANVALHYSYVDGEYPGAAGDEDHLSDFTLSPRAHLTGQEKVHDAPHKHLYSQCGPRKEVYPRDQAVLYGTYVAQGIPDDVVEKIKVRTLTAIMTRVARTLPFELVSNWSELLHDHVGYDITSSTNDAAVAQKASIADSPMTCESEGSQCNQSKIIQRIFAATITGFSKSMKKSILDYVLLSKIERTRLGLPRGTPKEPFISPKSTRPNIQRPDSGSCTARQGKTNHQSCNELFQVALQKSSALAAPPAYLRAKCRMARQTLQNKLLLTTTTFVQCHRIWKDYDGVLLLKLPSIESVLCKSRSDANPPKPQTFFDFERRQMEWLESVCTMMKEKWLPQVARALLTEDGTRRFGNCKDEDPTAYFNVVALMMSSYLTETIRRTIDRMLTYFEAFLPGSERCVLPPAFVLVPNLKGSNINSILSIDVTAAKLRKSISRILDRVSTAFNDLERIEVWQRRHSQFAQKARPHENRSGMAVSEHRSSEKSASSIQAPANNDQQRECNMFLTLVTADGHTLADARSRILHVLDANLEIAAERLSMYQPFEFLLHASSDDEQSLVSTLVLPHDNDDRNDNMSKEADAASSCGRKINEVAKRSSEDLNSRLAKLRKLIDSYKQRAVEIARPRNCKPMHLLELDLDGLCSKLIEKSLERAQKLTTTFARGITADLTILIKKTRVAIFGLQQRPKTVSELLAAHEMVEHARSVDLVELQSTFLTIWRKVEFLVEQNDLAASVIDAACEACTATKNVQEQIERAAELLVIDKNMLKKKLGKRREEVKAQLTIVGDTVHGFAEKGNAKLLREYIDQLKEARMALSSLIAGVKELNEEETMLGLTTKTDFPSIADIRSELHAYELLWNTALRFHTCYSSWVKGESKLRDPAVVTLYSVGAIRSLDGATVMRDHAEMVAVFDGLSKHLTNTSAIEPAKVATSIHEQLEQFSTNLPIINALSSKFLADDDWRKFSSVLGFAISPKNITNLANFLVSRVCL